jgi:superfamily II DNA or RNA helicase
MQAHLPARGTVLWIRGLRWRVEGARRTGKVIRLDVANTIRRLTFLAPFDRPAIIRRRERMRRARPRHVVSRLARVFSCDERWHALASAVRARVEILPYQLEPLLALFRGQARRLLLADDVGLGKTIQAGFIIAEMRRRNPALRALVVAPAALRTQWHDELRDRFHLHAEQADAHSIDRLARAGARGDNPWRRSGIWIASLDYLKQAHVRDVLALQPWDLLVIDEAHGVCGDSDRHVAAAALARRSRHLLLLTATPHSGDDERFARLAKLGTIEAPFDDLQVFRRTRRDVGLSANRRVHWHHVPLSDDERRLLDVLSGFERTVLMAAGETRRPAALLLLSVFRKRALSTTAALLRSVERRLSWVDSRGLPDADDWLQGRFDFEGGSDQWDADDINGLTAEVGLSVDRERSWLRRLQGAATAALSNESKLAHLVRLLRRSREPAVIFTEFRDSLERLRARLGQIRSTAVIHGGLSANEQQKALDHFLGGPASVLLATDVAGQGLNLQSRARWIISVELPWNPARLEQRVGRVDRIGQNRRVHVTQLVARHVSESGMLLRLARRTLAAQLVFGQDILAATSPSAVTVQAHLLTGHELEPASTRVHAAVPGPCAMAVCRRWKRPAAVVARRVQRLRAFRDRCPVPSSPGGARWTRASRLRFLPAPFRHGAILLFSVQIIDSTGGSLEHHVVAVRAADPLRPLANRDVVEAARDAAARLLGPRVRRLRHLRRHEIEISAERENAIGRGLLTSCSSSMVQAGLFDLRETRAAQRSFDERAEIQRCLDAQLRILRDALEIEIDQPTLELVLTA